MKLLKENRRWNRARLHFWLFNDREVLEHFFTMAREGRFGDIRLASGHGQDRMGAPFSFTYRRGKLTFRRPDEQVKAEAGWVDIEGRFTSQDLIQMRNHTAFHLRMMFKQEPLSRPGARAAAR